MKKWYLSIVAASIILSGCGGDSKIPQNGQYNSGIGAKVQVSEGTESYDVRAVDDEIVGATVSASECSGFEEISDGNYRLTGCISKPSVVKVSGGKIVLNDDGSNCVDGNCTLDLTFPLILNTKQLNQDNDFVVTPLTTIIADANNTEINQLANKLGLTKDQLFADTTQNSDVQNRAQKAMAIFLAAGDNGITDKLAFIDKFKDALKTDGNFTAAKKSLDNSDLIKSVGVTFAGFVTENVDLEGDDILNKLKTKKDADKPKGDNSLFIGFVYDKQISDANISLIDTQNTESEDDDTIIASTTSKANSQWSLSVDVSQLGDDEIYMLKATKDGTPWVLTSMLTGKELRSFKGKKVTFANLPNLVISNVTTAQQVVMTKKDVFNNVENFKKIENDTTVYYKDIVKKASISIKAVIDYNATLPSGINTKDFVEQNLEISDDNSTATFNDSDINKSKKADASTDMKDDATLQYQLKNIKPIDSETKTFIKNSNYTFYRIFARLDTNGEVEREYTKYVLAPGNFEETKYRLKNENGKNVWEKISTEKTDDATFSGNNFTVNLNGNKESFMVVEKNHREIEMQNGNGINDMRTYEYSVMNVKKGDDEQAVILIPSKYKDDVFTSNDGFDIVDSFRRLESFKKDDGTTTYFDELKSRLKNYYGDRTTVPDDELNIEMNRYFHYLLENNLDKFAK